MVKNYLKIALRNLVRNKVSSFINIGGLAMGMAVAMLIGLWIHDEFSYNKSFQHYNRIAQVMVKYQAAPGAHASLPMPLGTTLRSSFADDFTAVILSSQTEDHVIATGDKKFTQKGRYMQPEGPYMFSLAMLKGSRGGLKAPNSIMLSQSVAKKLFGDVDPISKTIQIDNKQNVTVTGVYADLPANNEFKDMSFVAPWDLDVSSNQAIRGFAGNWGNNFLNVYVQIAPNTDFDKVSAKIKNLKLGHVGPDEAAAQPSVFLHPMSKWHLYSTFGDAGAIKTSEQLKFVWFYGIIGVFVLLLACINFMNLSTARSEKRAKEVGVRKAIGSMRKQLISQFYCESLLVAMLAFALSLIVVYTILPWFNSVGGKNISILWSSPIFWAIGIAFTLFTGLLAGSYPAIYLSSFNPVKVLKGTFKVGRFASMPRKVLVVIQFTVSIALIIGTTVVYRQIQFAKNRPVGYSQNGLLMFNMVSPDFSGKFNIIKEALKNTGAVVETAEAYSPLTSIGSGNSGFEWKGKDAKIDPTFGTLPVTTEYGKTVGWQFVDGRDFAANLPSDSAGFVVNEAAVKLMGLKKPVGENLKVSNGWFANGNLKILGVVKDMVMRSPFEPAQPTIFFIKPEADMDWILMKLNPALSAGQALPKIEAVFKKIVPSSPFDYQFADDEYAAKFTAEQRIGSLASFFAVLAVLISFLGLFGLASFVAEQRTKEIGVRKVLGASVFSVWQLLSKDFIVLVVIACVIAVPTANYFMSQWLQKYEYHTEISWWILAAAIIGALIITLLTVSYQSIKAAIANPVKSLKTE